MLTVLLLALVDSHTDLEVIWCLWRPHLTLFLRSLLKFFLECEEVWIWFIGWRRLRVLHIPHHFRPDLLLLFLFLFFEPLERAHTLELILFWLFVLLGKPDILTRAWKYARSLRNLALHYGVVFNWVCCSSQRTRLRRFWSRLFFWRLWCFNCRSRLYDLLLLFNWLLFWRFVRFALRARTDNFDHFRLPRWFFGAAHDLDQVFVLQVFEPVKTDLVLLR